MDHSAKRLHDPRAFVLHLALNTKNIMIWAPWNPLEEVECMSQGDLKVMAFCGMVDGRMLTVKWMVDDNGRPHSMTLQRYQEMLQQHVWPEVRNQSSRRNYWFWQDGATSTFSSKKSCGRVISCRSPLGHNWPPYSPDLNHLDSIV